MAHGFTRMIVTRLSPCIKIASRTALGTTFVKILMRLILVPASVAPRRRVRSKRPEAWN